MCLAIPGRVQSWLEQSPPFVTARVEFGGVCRNVNLACVPEAEVGDYVLVHAGIAITRLRPDEAARVWDALSQAELAAELTTD